MTPAALAKYLAFKVSVHRANLRIKQRTHRNEPLSFKDWAYLRDIYEDPALDICIQSCVQSGKSEWLLATDFALAFGGFNVLHVLPDITIRNRFVQGRVDKTILATKDYRTQIGESQTAVNKRDVNRVALKKIGDGMVNYVGSMVAKAFIEYPADAVIIDEEDRCDAENLVLALDRMDASKLKMVASVGNPSIVGQGINARYQASDQKQWYILCECGEWQPLDFFINVVEVDRDGEGRITNYRIRGKGRDGQVLCFCRQCGEPVDRLASGIERAEWRAGQPGVARSGRLITQLFSPRISLDDLWENLNASKDDPGLLQIFYNSKLGLPMAPEGTSLTEATLNACIDKTYARMPNRFDPGTGRVCAGIDVGRTFHVRITDNRSSDRKRRALFIGTITGWGPLLDLLKRYNTHVAVIDAMPEIQATLEFQKRARAKGVNIWRCHIGGMLDSNVREPQYDDEDRLIKIHRTVLLDIATAAWTKRLQMLPRNAGSVDGGDYYKQMCENVRFLDEDARGNHIYRWTKGADHHRFADAFDELASKLGGGGYSVDDVMTSGRGIESAGMVW